MGVSGEEFFPANRTIPAFMISLLPSSPKYRGNFRRMKLSRSVVSWLLFSVLVLPAARAAAENADLPERVFPALDQILRDALQQSPRILARNLDLDIAQGDEMQAKAGLYPSVGGYLQYQQARETREDVKTGSYPTNMTNYSFSASQPVWHWGAVKNGARIGEIRRKISEQQYVEAFRLLAQEIRANYLGLITRRALVKSARFNLKLTESALQVAEDRLAKGTISGGDIFPTRMNALQLRLSTDRSIEDFEQTRRSFRLLTGRLLSDDEIPEMIPLMNGGDEVPSKMLADFLSQKEPQTSSLIIARQQLEVENLNLKIQRKRLYPMFNFVAGVNQNRQSYTQNIGQLYGVQDEYAGVNLTWSIFDGFSARGAVKSSLARKRQLEASYRQLTESLSEDAQRLEKQVEFSLRQMRINDRLLEERGSFLHASEEDFQRGTSAETDLNAARASFFSSQLAAFNARAEYLQRMSEFLGAIMEDPVLQQTKVTHHE
jgi:outer membrane protein TolC